MAEKMTLARPYAKAIFEIAKEKTDFDVWAGNLSLLSRILQSPKVKSFITNPEVSATKTQAFLDSFFQAADSMFSNFIRLLIIRKRLAIVPEIETLFKSLRQDFEGVLEVRLVTAGSLDDAQKTYFKKTLSNYFQKEILLSIVEDPSIVGGVVIYARDLVIDNSIKGQLTKMKKIIGG